MFLNKISKITNFAILIYNSRNMNSNTTLSKLANFSIFTAAIILLLIFAQNILIPIVIAAFLAMLMVPMVNWLERKKVNRVISISLAIVLILLVWGGVISLIVGQVTSFNNDFAQIQERFYSLLDEVKPLLNKLGEYGIVIELEGLEQKAIDWVVKNMSVFTNALTSTLSSLSLIILIPVYLFMFLLYRDHFVVVACKMFKDHEPSYVSSVVGDLRRVIQDYLSGVLKVMAILIVLNFIAFTAIGLKHALFFAMLGGFLNIIPYIGPWIGSVLPVMYALVTKDSLFYPIAIFVAIWLIQTVENNYLTPKIVGSNVNLNPIASFIALILGGFIWGVVGMIIFIPAFAILKKVLELSPNTEVYGYLLGEEPKEETKKNMEKVDNFFRRIKPKK